LVDQSLSDGARILPLLFGVSESTVGLEIPVDGIRCSNSGRKTGSGQSGAAGGAQESMVEGSDKIEAEIHLVTQRNA
jgi:hypothetical protein